MLTQINLNVYLFLKKELEEISEKLDDFFEKVSKEPEYDGIDNFLYVSNRRERSINDNDDVNMKFKRDTDLAHRADQAIEWAHDKTIIFKKETITIKTSVSEGLIAIVGPFGGVRLCCIFG